MANENKIITEQNYGKYIHYLESNLIGLSVYKIFKYRALSCLKFLLYISERGNLSIIEDGDIFVKRREDEQDYLLTKLEETEAFSLFIKDKKEDIEIGLNDWCVIRHKIFKDFYLVYPYMEADNKTLKFVAKEGKINLLVIFIFLILIIMSLFL